MELISPSPLATTMPAPRSPVKNLALTEASSGLSVLGCQDTYGHQRQHHSQLSGGLKSSDMSLERGEQTWRRKEANKKVICVPGFWGTLLLPGGP